MNKFIVFEGCDGSGKSTQARLLHERIGGILTRQPSDYDCGKLLREFLRGERKPLPPRAMGLLFAADCVTHAEREIVPALKDGHVVCDRYYLSNIVYRAAEVDERQEPWSANGSEFANLMPQFGAREEIARWAAALPIYVPTPDLTIVLHVSPVEAMARRSARGAEELYDGMTHIVSMLYKNAARIAERLCLAGNVMVVDGSGSIDDVAKRVWQTVQEVLGG